MHHYGNKSDRSERVALRLALLGLLSIGSCDWTAQQSSSDKPNNSGESAETEMDDYEQHRKRMISRHLAARDITDDRVLKAMESVPRHLFVPAHLRDQAYRDSPLPIGSGQTISQPYIVALMTQLAQPQPGDIALDVGTGSGYQAAVLAELVEQVFSIEIVQPLADEAAKRLAQLGYDDVQVRHGDGYEGWKSEAPFDLIVLAAAPDHVPPELIKQLAGGGRMVLPVGDRYQKLIVLEKDDEGNVTRKEIAPVRFVPMTGKAEVTEQ